MSDINTPSTVQEPSPKSFTATLLLTHFLGWLGVHRFYVGRWLSGLCFPALLIGAGFSAYKMATIIHQAEMQGQEPPSIIAAFMLSIILIGFTIWVWVLVDLIRVCMHKFRDSQKRIVTRPSMTPEQTSERSFTASFLFCAFLGVFGVHRFYNGKIGTGLTILLLYLFGWILIIPLPVVMIWVLVDLIMLACLSFKDAEGRYVLK